MPFREQLVRMSPVRFIALLLATIFVTEAGIMLVLPVMVSTHASKLTAVGVDAFLLVVILAPILWWMIVHPLQSSAVSEQHRATRLVAILEATPDLVGIADLEGRLAYLNPAGRKMLGMDEVVDLTKHNLREFYDAANVHVVLTEGIPAAIRDGAWSGETELVALDGHAIVTSQVILAHKAPDGTVTFLSTIARDVTDRKRAQEALAESEGRYAALFANMVEGFAYCQMLFEGNRPQDFVYLAVNTAFETLTGLQNVVGRRATEIFPGIREAAPELFEAYGRVAQTGHPERFEHYFKPLDAWLDISVYKPREGCFVAVFDNITERKLADEKLRLQSAALNAAADAMIITDRDGTIEWINAAFTGSSGYNEEEALGKNPRDLVKSGVHDQLFYKELWNTILAGRIWHGELTNRRKDGSLCPVAMTITPVKDAHGEPAHFISISRDLTEERGLEAQFRQAQKMENVGQLAGGIAHDFNNLLTVINGTAEFALMQLRAGDPLHEDLQEIRRAGERAAALTRQLLAFSRKQILQPQVLNLNTVVAEVESMLRRLIREDIDLVVAPTQGLGSVKVDPGQIEQVIANLAVNARDAMPQGGKLTIEMENVEIDEPYASQHGVAVKPGHYVMLAMSDTGIGMDEATQERIFEPFFTTKGPGKGTGLGLSTVYGIVKQSDGFIWVYSEVGQGTSFKIYLPRVAEVAGGKRRRRTIAPAHGTETILLVEDVEGLRELAKRMLESAGYTVLTAANGEEALLFLERYKEPVHLLVTDIVMPGMSGRTLAERSDATRPGVKVLYMSGYTDDVIVRHGALDEGMPFLGKPFTVVDLTRKVREVLDSES